MHKSRDFCSYHSSWIQITDAFSALTMIIDGRFTKSNRIIVPFCSESPWIINSARKFTCFLSLDSGAQSISVFAALKIEFPQNWFSSKRVTSVSCRANASVDGPLCDRDCESKFHEIHSLGTVSVSNRFLPEEISQIHRLTNFKLYQRLRNTRFDVPIVAQGRIVVSRDVYGL